MWTEIRQTGGTTRHEHVRVLADVSIHDLLKGCDAVCGINSTVLLEALCCNKPAITLGSSCFTGKGFTVDVQEARTLGEVLRPGAGPRRVTEEQQRLFRRFLPMMLWEGNGGNGFFLDIDNFDAARLIEA